MLAGLVTFGLLGGMSLWSYFHYRDRPEYDQRPSHEKHTVAQFEAWCTDEFGGQLTVAAGGGQESCHKDGTVVDYDDWVEAYAN